MAEGCDIGVHYIGNMENTRGLTFPLFLRMVDGRYCIYVPHFLDHAEEASLARGMANISSHGLPLYVLGDDDYLRCDGFVLGKCEAGSFSPTQFFIENNFVAVERSSHQPDGPLSGLAPDFP